MWQRLLRIDEVAKGNSLRKLGSLLRAIKGVMVELIGSHKVDLSFLIESIQL